VTFPNIVDASAIGTGEPEKRQKYAREFREGAVRIASADGLG